MLIFLFRHVLSKLCASGGGCGGGGELSRDQLASLEARESNGDVVLEFS